jgi:hypothetical protein
MHRLWLQTLQKIKGIQFCMPERAEAMVAAQAVKPCTRTFIHTDKMFAEFKKL